MNHTKKHTKSKVIEQLIAEGGDPERELYQWLQARLERNLPLDEWHRRELTALLNKLKTGAPSAPPRVAP